MTQAGAPDRVRLAAFKLAVYLHDPPWKPWGIARGGYRLAGGRGEYAALIAAKFGEKYRRATAGLVEELLRCRGVGGCGKASGRLARALQAAAERAESIAAEARRDCERSHVRQSLLLLGLLEAFLESLGAGGWASVAREARERLRCSGGSEPRDIHVVDVYASSLDRVLLGSLYGGEGREEKGDECAKRPRLVNIFNPAIAVENNGQLGAGQVADYVAALLSAVGAAYLQAGGDGSDPMLLYELVYSLAEPVWYLVLGPGHVPVADTRTPHHTVFDHAAAAAMVSNWFLGGGDEPRGCMAVVDLASVQGWIAESRRLRDTWAASWLASWLAWEAVKPLAEKYGPDVLVQPPPRLNPFYASWLLSRLGCKSSDGGACGLLAALLGLPHGWPLDPTMPSTVKLALPPGACGNLEREVEKGLRDAWAKIAGRLAEHLGAVGEVFEKLMGAGAVLGAKECDTILRGRGAAAPGEAWKRLYCILARHHGEVVEKVRALEPPLPLRLTVRSLDEASAKLRGIIEEIVDVLGGKAGLHGKSLERALLYQVLQDSRLWRDAPLLSAAGRRSGQGYLDYARLMHERRGFLNCHVCGAAAAVVDGEALRQALSVLKQSSELRQSLSRESYVALRRLASNVGAGERLCPYCLAKRMLRDLLYHDKLAESLVGLEMPQEVYERLGRVTVDAYTSLVGRSYAAMRDMVGELLGDPQAVASLLLPAHVLGLVAPNRFLDDVDYQNLVSTHKETIEKVLQGRGYDDLDGDLAARLGVKPEDIVVTAEALVLEAVSDDAFTSYLYEKIGAPAEKLQRLIEQKRERRELRGKRRFAILQADGDTMGSGVLSGYLGVSAREYADRALCRLRDENLRRRLVDSYTGLVEAYEKAVRSLTGSSEEEKRTVIVTPSYHQAVSRALAVQALLDREAVERLGGLFLYSGGDDASAVLQPARAEAGNLAYPALEAADALRRLYWGIKPRADALRGLAGPRWGFNTISAEPLDKKKVLTVVPALAAYGRSVAVYYVGVKEPFWASFARSHELLDSKDHVVFRNRGREARKDALIVASSSSGAAVLPLNPSLQPATVLATAQPGSRAVEETVARPVEAIAELLRQIEGERKKLSASILSDAKNYVAELLLLAWREGCKKELAERLVEKLVDRNKVGSADAAKLARRLLEALGCRCPGPLAVDGACTTVHVDGGAVVDLMSDGYSVDTGTGGRAKASPAVAQLIDAARVTRGSS